MKNFPFHRLILAVFIATITAGCVNQPLPYRGYQPMGNPYGYYPNPPQPRYGYGNFQGFQRPYGDNDDRGFRGYEGNRGYDQEFRGNGYGQYRRHDND